MENETKEFIRSLVKAGLRDHEVRRQLISQGYSTANFVEEYKRITNELVVPYGVDDVKAQKHESITEDKSSAPVGFLSIFGMLKYASSVSILRSQSIVAASTLMTLAIFVFMALPNEPVFLLNGVPFIVVNLLAVVIIIYVSLLSFLALFYTIISVDEEDSGFMIGLQWAKSNFISLVWLTMLGTCIAVGGFAFLIIPGVTFLVYNLFSLVVIAKEQQKGMLAIVRSTDLISGSFWSIFFRVGLLFFILCLINFLVISLLQKLNVLLAVLPAVDYILVAILIYIEMTMSAIIVAAVYALYQTCVRNHVLFDTSVYRFLLWSYRFMFVAGLAIIGGVIIFSDYSWVNIADRQFNIDFAKEYSPFPSDQSDGGEIIDDTIVRTRLNEAFVSAGFYVGRIGFIEGVCKDVIREDPVECDADNQNYVMYAPLTNGRYYCRDNNDFKGELKKKPSSATCS